MNRYLIENTATDPYAHLLASIQWLKDCGGGYIVSNLKSNLASSFDCKTDSDFQRLRNDLLSSGIKLTWSRNGLPSNGNVVAAFTSKHIIEELDSMDGIDNLLVLGWATTDYEEWAEKNDPTILQLKK